MRIIQSQNPRPLNLLAVGPNGLVAAASNAFGLRNDVEVWDATTGAKKFAYNTPYREPRSIAFTPDGKYLFAAVWQQIAVVEVATHASAEAPRPLLDFADIELSANGSRLLMSTMRGDEGHLACWSVEPGPAYRRLWEDGPHGEYFRFEALALSRDATRAAVFERPNLGASGRPVHRISIREAATGKQLTTIVTDIASPVQQLAFTADGAKLLVRTESRTVQLFGAATGASAGELVHPGRPYVTGMAVHPRGPVACVRTNGTVTFWDVEKREQIRTLDWKAGRLVSVAFSPDGSLAAAGSEDGKIVVWDVDL